ncbi:hypothetical protein [Nocardioides sp. InS609-2]|uniref:hypothetical protein n=1 Tax=Nocardioides sp. InS609-2 TaxID=2760705 RepID=UPI0020BE30D9|nr:hypothetical protein [Nocardioides sp. InS609-2]
MRWVAGSVVMIVLAGCSGQATPEVAAEALALPCPVAQQRRVALDVPGPGRPTPEEAVAPFAEASELVVEVVHGETVVFALAPDGQVVRVFSVSKHRDGWWPDGYAECLVSP